MKKLFKEHDLAVLIFGLLAVIILLSWVIPAGYFSGGTFVEGEPWQGIGLLHITYGIAAVINSYSMSIAFLILVGIFYGIASKTESYKALVTKLANLAKGHVISFACLISLIVAVATSMLNNTIVLFMFIPLLVSVLLRMGVSKMNAFASTFGSMLVGTLGATIGSEGLGNYVYYLAYSGMEVTITTEVVIRVGILLLTYVLFTFFNIVSMKKSLNNKKDEAKEDVFAVEEPKKRAKAWPMVLAFVVLFAFAILGFVAWEEGFGITALTDFYEDIMAWKIGDVAVLPALLGTNLVESQSIAPHLIFGDWYLFTYSIFLFLVIIVVMIASRKELNETFENAWDGIKKFAKPIAFVTLAYFALILLDFVSFIPAVVNELGKMSSAFNPFVASLQALIVGLFNSQLDFVGYSLSGYLIGFTGVSANIINVVYITMFGLMQFITPISVALVFGLSYMDIPYKKWFQYIWKFFVGMLVCLLVIFTLLTYL